MSVLRNRVAVAKPETAPKPPPTVQWACEPFDGWGLLQINDTLYRVQEVPYSESDGTPRMLVRLLRAGAEMEYQVSPDSDGSPCCDCPHACYRDAARTCKHAVGVGIAYQQLDRQRRLSDFLDDGGRPGCVPCPACGGRGERYCPGGCDGLGELPAEGGAA
jgi:hypothetical protein